MTDEQEEQRHQTWYTDKLQETIDDRLDNLESNQKNLKNRVDQITESCGDDIMGVISARIGRLEKKVEYLLFILGRPDTRDYTERVCAQYGRVLPNAEKELLDKCRQCNEQLIVKSFEKEK